MISPRAELQSCVQQPRVCQHYFCSPHAAQHKVLGSRSEGELPLLLSPSITSVPVPKFRVITTIRLAHLFSEKPLRPLSLDFKQGQLFSL